MKDISFFAKPPQFRKRTSCCEYPHLLRGSSLIRAWQMAEYMGAKLNPTSGYENDVLIYI